MTVIEASAFVAAPLAGLLLSQLGARVIRVDPIGGGLDYGRWPLAESGQSFYWAGLNKGKESVALDIRSEDGREVLGALVARAGTFLTNLPPRGWLSYETLRARRPDLIMLSVAGNRDGSIAVDYTVNAASGFPWVTGDGRAPVNHVFPAWDVTTALSAVIALQAAHHRREATGEGEFVSLALADMAFSLLSHLGYIAETQVMHRNRPAMGNTVYGNFGRDFRTRDGRHIMIVAITERQWRALVSVTGLARKLGEIERAHGLDLNDEGDRYNARDRIFPLVERWVGARDLADIRALFDEAGVLWGPFQTFTQIVEEDDRCSTANPMFSEIEQAGIGRHLAAGLPMDFAGLARCPARPAPVLGEHTDAVLSDMLGLSASELERLRRAGVLADVESPPKLNPERDP